LKKCFLKAILYLNKRRKPLYLANKRKKQARQTSKTMAQLQGSFSLSCFLAKTEQLTPLFRDARACNAGCGGVTS